MKRFFRISAYEDTIFTVILFIVIILYLKKPIFLIFACVYIYKRYSCKELIFLLLIISMIFLRLIINTSEINYYYIHASNNDSIEMTNLINNVRIKNTEGYETGDIILIKGERYINDSKDLKASNRYYSYSDYEIQKLFHLPNFRNLLLKTNQNNSNIYSKSAIDNLLFKTYDNSDLELSLSLLFLYKILNKLFFKIKYHQVITFILIVFIFGLSYSLIRIILYEIILHKTGSKKTALALTAILMIFVNPYSIYSYRFIIPMLIRMIFIFKKNDSFFNIMVIIQSLFFFEVKPLQIITFKYYLMIVYGLLFISILNLWITPLNILVDLFYFLTINLKNVIDISIRGKINIIILVIYLFFRYFFKNIYVRSVFLISILLLNVSNIAGTVTFIDVGQGDSILIRAPFNSFNILIDTGSKYSYYKLDRTLKAYGIKNIDALIITHEDSDHSGNLDNLSHDYFIDMIISDHGDYINDFFYLKSLNDNTHDNDNDNSLVFLMRYHDLSFLFTGDISKKTEMEIIRKEFFSADVLKVSHHGSKTGTSLEFLKAVNPEIAVISTNGMYNHPASEVTDLLKQFNIAIFSTKEEGNISFYFTNIIDFIKCSDGEFVIIR